MFIMASLRSLLWANLLRHLSLPGRAIASAFELEEAADGRSPLPPAEPQEGCSLEAFGLFYAVSANSVLECRAAISPHLLAAGLFILPDNRELAVPRGASPLLSIDCPAQPFKMKWGDDNRRDLAGEVAKQVATSVPSET
jgi:hypothetical protein